MPETVEQTIKRWEEFTVILPKVCLDDGLAVAENCAAWLNTGGG